MKYDITLLNYSSKFNIFFILDINNYSSIQNLISHGNIKLVLTSAIVKLFVWQKTILNQVNCKTIRVLNPSYKSFKVSTFSYLKSTTRYTLKSYLIRSNSSVSKHYLSLTTLKWSTSKAILFYTTLSKFCSLNLLTYLLYFYTYLQISSIPFSVNNVTFPTSTASVKYKRLFTQNLLTL